MDFSGKVRMMLVCFCLAGDDDKGEETSDDDDDKDDGAFHDQSTANSRYDVKLAQYHTAGGALPGHHVAVTCLLVLQALAVAVGV